MTHDEFMNNYGGYLEHKWVTSKDKAKAEAQKRAETAYNAEYYRKNKERILAQQRAHRSGARSGNLLTSEEALNALNRQQLSLEGGFGPKLGNHPELSETEKGIREQQIREMMRRAPLLSRNKAEILWENKRAREQREQRDIDVRNERMKTTGLNQGAQQRASVNYNIQNRTLSKRSSSDTAASEAQANARNPRRQQNTLNKRSSSDVEASRAQANAAANRRNTALSNVQSATLARQSQSNARASEAQAQAARNNATYNKSLTSRIVKNASKASKKITDVILDANAAKQKAIDIYNDTSAKINKAKKSVQIILNRYFG
jgi:hypothetical protein